MKLRKHIQKVWHEQNVNFHVQRKKLREPQLSLIWRLLRPRQLAHHGCTFAVSISPGNQSDGVNFPALHRLILPNSRRDINLAIYDRQFLSAASSFLPVKSRNHLAQTALMQDEWDIKNALLKKLEVCRVISRVA
jgi:hypothetical protein